MKKRYFIFLMSIVCNALSHAQPVINSFTPYSGPAGSTVTISGAGFDANPNADIVFFGAARATVATATATQLTVTVPAGTTYKPISVMINGLIAFSNAPFILTFPVVQPLFTQTSFCPYINTSTSFHPGNFCTVDMDDDARPDLVVVDQTGQAINSFRNNSNPGNLMFNAAANGSSSGNPTSVDYSDFDFDGKPDFVTCNNNAAALSFFKNNSSAGNPSLTFIGYYSTIFLPASLAIDDIDVDGKPDIVVQTIVNPPQSNFFSITRNIGTPGSMSFAPPAVFPITGTQIILKLLTGDLDGDQLPDIIYSNYYDNNISISRNQTQSGIISFSAQADLSTPQYPMGMSMGDLDGDGKPDIAIADQSGFVSIFRNNSSPGSIGFDPRIDLPAGQSCSEVVFGDLDGDGKVDLAVINSDPVTALQRISVYKNQSTPGNIAFALKVDYPASATVNPLNSVQLADYDGDGRTDIAVANYWDNEISILRNNIPFTITKQPVDSTICAGANASFSINTSLSTGYQWQVDMGSGWIDVTDGSFYTGTATNTITIISATVSMSGYKYRCVAKHSCQEENSLVGTLFVNPSINPSVTISASSINVCVGQTVTFIAVSMNTGASPLFQWKKNSLNVGTGSTSYSDNNLQAGDVINCVVTSALGNFCANTTATSNSITMQAASVPVPVDLGGDRKICKGSELVLQSQSTYADYLWQDNSTNPTLTVTDTGSYHVKATDACGNISVDTVIISFHPTPGGFLPPDSSVCSSVPLLISPTGNYNHYLWSNNSVSSFISIDKPGLYWLQVTDNNNCKGKDSINISPGNCAPGFHMPMAFTPNGDNNNELCRPLLFGDIRQYEFSVYNRYGERVFHSKDPGTGWDGRIKGNIQHTGVYVWICSYQLANEPAKQQKGTVILLK